MSEPLVSFVVPCYKLAHYLAECVESILSQTYTNLEVLIMDDCSPDNTAEVAKSFTDPRVRYVRNDPNLGHLRNYNKGIEISRGEYVWLISADDRIRVPYALSRYVSVMEANQNAAYACSSSVEIRSAEETGVVRYSVLAMRDKIFRGPQLLQKLLYANVIVAASGMVRRRCYTEHGTFPLDLPYAGDWYLWCLFALHYDVAYFAEPMVAYRIHDQSMTEALIKENVRTCAEDDVAVLWKIERNATSAGFFRIAKRVRRAISRQYAEQITVKQYRNGFCVMDMEQLERSLGRFTKSPREKQRMRAGVYASTADIAVAAGDSKQAAGDYMTALEQNFWSPKIWVKLALLRMGHLGMLGRTLMTRAR